MDTIRFTETAIERLATDTDAQELVAVGAEMGWTLQMIAQRLADHVASNVPLGPTETIYSDLLREARRAIDWTAVVKVISATSDRSEPPYPEEKGSGQRSVLDSLADRVVTLSDILSDGPINRLLVVRELTAIADDIRAGKREIKYG